MTCGLKGMQSVQPRQDQGAIFFCRQPSALTGHKLHRAQVVTADNLQTTWPGVVYAQDALRLPARKNKTLMLVRL